MSSRGIRLFLGPDRAGKLRRIHALERSLPVGPLDRHHVDAGDIRPAELLALCRQRPAASPVRLIVVEEAQRLPTQAVSALGQQAQIIAQSACLVLLVEVELPPRHPLRDLADISEVEEFAEREAPAAKPFALANALGKRDLSGALQVLHDYAAAGREPHDLLGLLAWQIQRWTLVRGLLDEGCSAQQISRAAGMSPWQVSRITRELTGRSGQGLQDLLTRCWQLDAGVKTGRIPPRLGVEQLVCDICRESPAGG